MLGVFVALGQALSWAGTTVMLRRVPTRLDPFLVNGLRAVVGATIIIPLALMSGSAADYRSLTSVRLFYLIGSVVVGGVIGDALYVAALRTLGVGGAFPITNTYPLLTLLFGVLFLGEQPTVRVIVGMALAIAGIYLVAHPRGHVTDATIPLPRRQILLGVALAIGTAIFWSLSTVMLAAGLGDLDTFVANSVRVPAAVLFCLVPSALRGGTRSIRDLDWRTARLLIVSGALGWGLGSSLWVTAVRLLGASKAALIGATSPLFAVPLSAVFLHERPTRNTLLGTILTVIGIGFVV